MLPGPFGAPRYVSSVGDAGGDVVARAARLADDELFPTAAAIDVADAMPSSRLDLLAGAGLYGVAGPRWAGGSELDFPALCAVVEALAGGDLATAFVWVQHHGAVRVLSGEQAPPALRDAELGPLCRGERRAGLALPGLHPGPSSLTATASGDGWVLDGTAPWVTGWGLVDLVLVAARTPDDTVVWSLVEAVERPGLTAERLVLAAANASVTVELRFAGVPVGADRVVMVTPYDPTAWTSGGDLRLNGSLALGVAGRCCRLLGGGPIDDELEACRAALDTASPRDMPAARAAASAFAVKAATTLVVATGSRAALRGAPAERLVREALFLLVFGSRPAIKSALLDRLA